MYAPLYFSLSTSTATAFFTSECCGATSFSLSVFNRSPMPAPVSPSLGASSNFMARFFPSFLFASSFVFSRKESASISLGRERTSVLLSSSDSSSACKKLPKIGVTARLMAPPILPSTEDSCSLIFAARRLLLVDLVEDMFSLAYGKTTPSLLKIEHGHAVNKDMKSTPTYPGQQKCVGDMYVSVKLLYWRVDFILPKQ